MANTRKHTALLVIDMQKDFVEEDGLTRVDGGKAIVPSVIKAVEVARELGIFVVWVVREHDPLGRDVELFRRHFYGPGKIGPVSEGSVGAELVDGLVIKEGDYKLVKTRFSAFFATHLHSFLQSNGINSVVIVGVQTPNCIRQTVFGAVALDYQSVTVIVDAKDCFPTTMPSLSALILQTSGCQEILLSPPTVPWMPRLLNYDACCTFPFLDMLVEHRKYGGMGSNTTWAAENEPAATATATTIPSSLSPLTSPWD